MPYINLQQAADATGKSIRTIRRLCNSPTSKDYITYEDGKLQVEVSFLEQNYPMVNMPNTGMTPKNNIGQSHDMANQVPVPNGNSHNSEKLIHEIEMLKLELKYRDQITQEKDKQIELLERSLLMLGEGLRKDQEKQELSLEENEPATKKRRWWQW
jgi:hypothetical protein